MVYEPVSVSLQTEAYYQIRSTLKLRTPYSDSILLVRMLKPGPQKNPRAHEIEIQQQRERRFRDSVIKEMIADEVSIIWRELEEEQLLFAKFLAAERLKDELKRQKEKSLAEKSRRNVKFQNPQKPIAVEISASGERSEILVRETRGEPVYVPLDARLADKVENRLDMQLLPKNVLVNRFMGNKFEGKNYDDEIHYGIVVEYNPRLDRYLVAYDDRTYNFVPWASLCCYIIKEGHMEKSTTEKLKVCLETEAYRTYQWFTNTRW